MMTSSKYLLTIALCLMLTRRVAVAEEKPILYTGAQLLQKLYGGLENGPNAPSGDVCREAIIGCLRDKPYQGKWRAQTVVEKLMGWYPGSDIRMNMSNVCNTIISPTKRCLEELTSSVDGACYSALQTPTSAVHYFYSKFLVQEFQVVCEVKKEDTKLIFTSNCGRDYDTLKRRLRSCKTPDNVLPIKYTSNEFCLEVERNMRCDHEAIFDVCTGQGDDQVTVKKLQENFENVFLIFAMTFFEPQGWLVGTECAGMKHRMKALRDLIENKNGCNRNQ